MNKFIKFATSLLAAAALAMGCVSVAFADDSSVTFKDHDEAFVFMNGTEWHATDLFDNFKGVMPGDNLRQLVTVTNEDPDGRTVKIYMRAEAHDEEGNPLATAVAEDETVASMQDFLAQMHMTVACEGSVIFDGQPHVEDGLSEYVLLGEFATGESKTLEVTLSVPLEMGNDYAYREGEVDWVFYVEEPDIPLPPVDDGEDNPDLPSPNDPDDLSGPNGPGGNGGNGSGDGSGGNGGSGSGSGSDGFFGSLFAQTGDSTPFALVAAVACVAAVVVVVAAFAKKRSNS